MFPKISVITPSFNQVKFLEATILSVLGQNYSNLEYIIMDGGSTDGSVGIIKKYSSRLTYWISEKDQGQSHAINKGFDKATGNILLWLNSDDILMPNSLETIISKTETDYAAIYFGNCIHFKNDLNLFSYGSDIVSAHAEFDLENIDYIIQPSSFWTRKAWELTGRLREDMHYAFDWEWFLRAKKKGILFRPLSECISLYRLHAAHKTGTGGIKRDEELIEVYRLYKPENELLFKQLFADRNFFSEFLPRLIRKLIYIAGVKTSEMSIMKHIKYNAYKNYSLKHIAEVKRMVAN